MIAIGIDPGWARTGVTRLELDDTGTIVRGDWWHIEHDDGPEDAMELRAGLVSLQMTIHSICARARPDVVGIESGFAGRRRDRWDLLAAVRTTALTAVPSLVTTCYLAPSQARKIAMGNGRPRRADIREWIMERWPNDEPPTTADAHDATVVAVAAAAHAAELES